MKKERIFTHPSWKEYCVNQLQKYLIILEITFEPLPEISRWLRVSDVHKPAIQTKYRLRVQSKLVKEDKVYMSPVNRACRLIEPLRDEVIS